jgi:nucleotide-binding universal stress UspA family protein
MKVLLAIDESAYAAAAVREIEARLMAPETEVRVLHVVGTFVPPAASVVESGGSMKNVREDVLERYQDLVHSVAERLKDFGITAEGVVREGNVGKSIVKEATEWDADLIVIGAHGLTGLESLILGNVTRHVVEHAPCSVEVVRPKK